METDKQEMFKEQQVGPRVTEAVHSLHFNLENMQPVGRVNGTLTLPRRETY